MAESREHPSLGLEKGRVLLVEPSGEWGAQFELEAARVAKAFAAAEIPVEIRHIGSTALGTIRAKPLIDMAVVVSNKVELAKALEVAAQLGWVYLAVFDSGSDRLFADGNPRHFHYHLTVAGSRFDRNSKLMMRALTRSPQLRQEYEQLKIQLAEQFPEARPEYTLAKQVFLDRVLVRQVIQREARRMQAASRRTRPMPREAGDSTEFELDSHGAAPATDRVDADG